jgi:hypothetical protein
VTGNKRVELFEKYLFGGLFFGHFEPPKSFVFPLSVTDLV